MSSQALAVITALAELPIYLKKFIDTVYALAVAFVNFFNILEGSGLKKATTKAISRKLKSLHRGISFSTSSLPFASHPDTHTSSLPSKTTVIYADYAGAPPYSVSAVKAATEELLHGVWGNPHSDHGWESLTPSTASASIFGLSSSSAAADRIRQLTLEMCKADPNEYVCILTSGATAALKLVAETFPWSPDSSFLYLSDNHNSVLGIREVAAAQGATTQCVNPSDLKMQSSNNEINQNNKKEEAKDLHGGKLEKLPVGTPPPPPTPPPTQHLFAFPLESNFSGTRYSENLVLAVQNQTVQITDNNSSSTTENCTTTTVRNNGTWRVLLDAAKACATVPPDLSQYPADFVVLSYYKIFGYPSGLGALLVRRSTLCLLRKTYFGGGTVLSSSAEDKFHALRPGYAGFEDGTLPFLAFPAVLHSFAAWQHRGGFPIAAKAAHIAASRFATKLLAMKHSNGTPVASVYGQWGANNKNSAGSPVSGQGPTVAFNLRDPLGDWIGHRQVQRLASLEGIYLRTGVMCNPGACSTATGVKAIQAKAWFDHGHVCWDDKDVLDGVPTGAVRVSFGWGSTVADANAIAEFVKRHFVQVEQKENQHQGEKAVETAVETAAAVVVSEKEKKKHDDLRIRSLTIYPIKSASGFSPRSWPLNPTSGLLYDRHWAVVDAHGTILTLKKCPRLSSLHPVVYLDDRVMRIHAKGVKTVLEVPLLSKNNNSKLDGGGGGDDETEIGNECTNSNLTLSASFKFSPSSISTNASEWLTEALGIPCSLIEHQNYNENQNNRNTSTSTTSSTRNHGFSNEAQILLVTVASLQAIYKKSEIESSFEKFAVRFRPNIIVEEKYLPSSYSSSSESKDNGEEVPTEGGDEDVEIKEDRRKEDKRANITTQISSSSCYDLPVHVSTGVVDGIDKEDEMVAFEEEQWTSVRLTNTAPAHSTSTTTTTITPNTSSTRNDDDDSINFEVVGPCPRCEMICIDPTTGLREGSEPLLLTLAKERKGAAGNRRFCFGVLLNVVKERGTGNGGGTVGGGDDGEDVEQIDMLVSKKMKRVAVGMRVGYEVNQ